jgi:hypothetical protein
MRDVCDPGGVWSNCCHTFRLLESDIPVEKSKEERETEKLRRGDGEEVSGCVI